MKHLHSLCLKRYCFKQDIRVPATHHSLRLLSWPFFLFIFLVASGNGTTHAQSTGDVPCNGNYYFTRQISPSTKISSVNVNASGTVSITNIDSLNPNKNTNATGYYNGYIYTQDWSTSGTFTLLRVNYNGTYTSKAVSGVPGASSGSGFNNAGVDRDGIMYLLSTDASPVLYKIDLKNWATTLTSTSATCAMTTGSRIWGDIAFDPITDTAYAWYHPSSTPSVSQAPRGLYQIRNYKSSSPSIVKVGTDPANYTMGTLFFNERGQLFGYGVDIGNAGGSAQRYLYYIDKATGQPTRLGESETSMQSDGCECAYRLSLTLTAGADGTVEIPDCSTPSDFKFDLVANNTETISFDGIDFTFKLDPRFSFSKTAAEIKAVMQTKFGPAVNVVISDTATGTNNKLYISGLSVGVGSTPFEVDVKIATGGDEFTDGEIVNFQSHFGGLSEFYGKQEPSSDALAFFGKNESKITFDKTSDLCATSISGTVFNDPDAGNVNNSTGVANLVPTGMYANLLDGTNKVIASVAVSTDGTYTLPVTYQDTYKVRLSTTLPTAGTTLITKFTPAGWVYTGAYTGAANTDNSGDTTGTSAAIVMSTLSAVSDVNFGLNRRPETVVSVRAAQLAPAPGISTSVAGSLFIITTESGSPSTYDEDNGTVDSIRFVSFPTGADSVTINGNIYTSGNWPSGGITVVYSDTAGVSGISVYPSLGVDSVVLAIVSKDNGRAEDLTPGRIKLLFDATTISGTVFNDPDAGNVNNSTGVANLVPTGMYANLLDGTNKVIASVAVSTDGTYTLPVTYQDTYKVRLSTTLPTAGTTLTTKFTPAGWVYTGAYTGAANTDNSGDTTGTSAAIVMSTLSAVSDVNFGLNRRPETVVSVRAAQLAPAPGISTSVAGSLFIVGSESGSPFTFDDDNGTVDSIRFVSFPSGADSVTINGNIYTSSSWPSGGVTALYNSSTGVSGISVYPSLGVDSVVLAIVSKDNGRAEDLTPGRIKLLFDATTISGTVFNDPDAGNVNNSTGVANLVPTGMYANLLDGTNKVIASVAVSTDGTYTLPVTYQDTYKVRLSTTLPTAGTTLTTKFTPAGWVYTGAYTGAANTDNSGDTTGTSAAIVMSTLSAVSDVNFGLNRRPETVVSVRAAQLAPAPGISTSVAGSLFIITTESGSPSTYDEDNGTVDSIRFVSFPTGADSVTINGNIYTSGNWPSGGITVVYSDTAGVSGISVYPSLGVDSVVLAIVSKDNGRAEDLTPGRIKLLFDATTISGTVFNDPDAGNVNNSTGVANLVPTGMYANLLDGTNKVIASVAVSTDGTYTLPVTYQDTYKVRLSTTLPTAGTTLTTKFTPAGWVYTGAYTGAANTDNSGDTTGTSAAIVMSTLSAVSDVNFGLNRRPETVVSVRAAQLAPAPGISTSVAGSLFIVGSESGSPFTFDDDNGTVDSIRFVSFPSGADSVTINGNIYTSSSWPSGGVTALYNSSTGVSGISVYPSLGVDSVVLAIVSKDNGRAEDLTPGRIKLLFDATTISGTVFNDPDAGNVNNSTGEANVVPSGMYANLVDGTNKVIVSVAVSTNGTYTLPVTYQSLYSVKLSATAVSVGTTLTASFIPPNGWKVTGAYNGLPNTGNTGITTGTSTAFSVVGLSSYTNVNFAIQELPETVVNDLPSQFAPMPGTAIVLPGSWFVTPVVSGNPATTDYSNGTVEYIKFKAYPMGIDSVTIGGTTYTIGSWPVAGLQIPFDPADGITGVSIYPATGVTGISFPIASVDNGGAEDPTPGRITIPFAKAPIRGVVYNDPNAGNINNSTGTANAVPSGLYANLINEDGKVLSSILVEAQGSYALDAPYIGNYRVKLTNYMPTAGSTLTESFVPPVGWSYTGAYRGTSNTGNTGDTEGTSSIINVATTTAITNVNFGVQQLPQTVVNVITDDGGYVAGTPVAIPAVSFTKATLDTDPSTEDYSGGVVETIRFTGFPSGIDSITIKGVTYNATTWPDAGIIAGYSALAGVTGVAVYPKASITTIILPIASIDNAGTQDPSPGSITLNLDAPLPIQLLSFTVQQVNCVAVVNWQTGKEDDCELFLIERSKDGKLFESIGSAMVKGDNSTYSFEDHDLANGVTYYRLKMINPAGFEYSVIKSITSSCKAAAITLFPNPTTTTVTIRGLDEGQQIHIVDVTGKIMIEKQAHSASEQIDVARLAAGAYQVLITDAAGKKVQNFKLIKG